MRRGELEQSLSRTNGWWRSSSWQDADRDLREAHQATLAYRPTVLGGLQAGGMYLLVGPRRVGKSVELKRAVLRLQEQGVDRRRIVHAACDEWRARDIALLASWLDSMLPSDGGPRYVLLDEVTAIDDDWVAAVKNLRDTSSLRDDCVVLTGSNVARLADATKAFAGRQGRATDTTRLLLPMSFRVFCHAAGFEPDHAAPYIHPRDLVGAEALDAVADLRPYLHELVDLWERYLDFGGLPRSVDGFLTDRTVPADFVRDLWQVVHGDALASEHWTAVQSQAFLGAMVKHMGNPLAREDVVRAVQVSGSTVDDRLRRLERNFVAWPAWQMNGGFPKVNARRKWYFSDPLFARLLQLRDADRPAPDITQLSEQEIGSALLRVVAHEDPTLYTEFSSVMHQRAGSGKEIDFVGPWLHGLAYESKYVEHGWKRDAQTVGAAYRRGVLATRNIIERHHVMPDVWALPASVVAYLIDPTDPASVLGDT